MYLKTHNKALQRTNLQRTSFGYAKPHHAINGR